MGLTSAELELITRGNKASRERLAFKREIEQEIRASTARRAKIGDNYREKMLEKALKNAGVDYDLIRQRQAKESESALKDLKKLEARLNANVRTVAERHQQLREQLRRTKIFPQFRSSPAPGPAAITSGYLAAPTTTDLDDENTPKNAAITPGANANDGVYLTFDWKTKAVNSWGANIVAFFNYLWTPNTAGSLGVFSVAAYNGTGSWSINAGCGYTGWFTVGFATTLSVSQVDSAGHMNQAQVQPTTGIYDHHTGGCTHHSGSKPYDQVDYLELVMPFAVEKKLPVKISIEIAGYADAELGAGGEVDFSSTGKSINLPGVYYGFTPDS
jgi:ribosome maturation protein Sdo1